MKRKVIYALITAESLLQIDSRCNSGSISTRTKQNSCTELNVRWIKPRCRGLEKDTVLSLNHYGDLNMEITKPVLKTNPYFSANFTEFRGLLTGSMLTGFWGELGLYPRVCQQSLPLL